MSGFRLLAISSVIVGTLVAQSTAPLVLVPVMVRDHDGHAVTDLHKEDFQLLDQGKPRDIASFAVEKPGGHFIAWVFDDLQINDVGDFTRLRAAAIRQVTTLQPGDRAGIFTTSCRVVLDFTDSHAKLQDALSRLAFRPLPACTASKGQVVQFAMLGSAVRRMAALAAQRSVVFVSPGFLVEHARARDEAGLADLAIRSKTPIDVLDVGGAGSLIDLAHATGGRYVSGSDIDAGFRRLATPESYYVLGFAPSEADGGFHQLKVKLTNSRKLDVQARGGYFAPGKAPATVEAAQVAKPPARIRLVDAIQDPGPAAKQPVVVPVAMQLTTRGGTTVAPEAPPDGSPNTAEITSRDEPVTFSADTNLVMLPVVVRDAGGHAVGNLRKDDFQLTDKGRQREITRFSVRRTSAHATVTPVHYIAFLFDDVRLTPEDLARTRDALRRQMATLRPTDRVAVYTTSGTATPLEFTADREKVEAALLKLQPNPIAAAAGEQEARLSLAVVRDLTRRMSTLPGPRGIVLISPGFNLTDALSPDETSTLDRAIRANVIVSALNGSGRDSEILPVLAEGTGGTFVAAGDDLSGAFQRLLVMPEFVYTLGFAPEGLKADGSFHDLKVALKGAEKLTVQARRGYYAPKHAADPAEASRQDIEHAVFSRDDIRDLPVELSTQFLRAGAEARLTVTATMDVRQIYFRKTEGRNRNDVTVVSSLFDNNGNFIVGAQKVVLFRLRGETKKKLETEPPVTIRTVFNLKPGDYVVRMVARDAEGQKMAARSTTVEIR